VTHDNLCMQYDDFDADRIMG